MVYNEKLGIEDPGAREPGDQQEAAYITADQARPFLAVLSFRLIPEDRKKFSPRRKWRARQGTLHAVPVGGIKHRSLSGGPPCLGKGLTPWHEGSSLL
jgi:hypothetical protein